MADVNINKSRGKRFIGGVTPSIPSYPDGTVPPVVNPPGSGSGVNLFTQLGDVTDKNYIGKNGYSPVVTNESELTLIPQPTPITQVFTYVASNVFSLSFSLPHVIYVSLNGQVLREGGSYDWTVSGTSLTVSTPLRAGDEISILYYSDLPLVTLYRRNIDGGAPDSVYLPIQNVDGGTP